MQINFRMLFFSLIVSGLVACAGTPQTQQKIARVPLADTFKAGKHFNNLHLVSLANEAATKYGIDNSLFHALIQQESAWDPIAKSPKGARGLTQIMPSTGKSECGLNRDLLYDPKLNLHCGAFYFGKLLHQFRNVKLALAAYNSGATRVARLGRVPRIRETQQYVKRIMKNWRNRHRYDEDYYQYKF